MGFGVWGSGFGVWGTGFGVWGIVELETLECPLLLGILKVKLFFYFFCHWRGFEGVLGDSGFKAEEGFGCFRGIFGGFGG